MDAHCVVMYHFVLGCNTFLMTLFNVTSIFFSELFQTPPRVSPRHPLFNFWSCGRREEQKKGAHCVWTCHFSDDTIRHIHIIL